MAGAVRRVVKKQMVKLYRLQTLEHSAANDCGGVTLFAVVSSRHVRCHHVLHMEGRVAPCLRQFRTWENVWNACGRWCQGIKRRKGKLKRGIGYAEENGIRAVVEDQQGLYYVHGVWG